MEKELERKSTDDDSLPSQPISSGDLGHSRARNRLEITTFIAS